MPNAVSLDAPHGERVAEFAGSMQRLHLRAFKDKLVATTEERSPENNTPTTPEGLA